MARRLKKSWMVGLILFSSMVMFFSSSWPGAMVAYAQERYTELQLFTKVLNIVQRYYVDDVDTKKLIEGALKGMLKELDPHTNWLSTEIYKEFESETSGEFGGLGIEITVQDGILTIISPIEDTPAWQAGLKAGDKIVEINGEPTKGLSLAEAAQRMRGKKGSAVQMMIMRDGFEKPKKFAIKRGTVKVRSVKYTDLEDGYAYIRLTSFIENSAKELEKALSDHEKKNNGRVNGLILDLRRNPGGLLDQAVQISDLFLEKGVIVSTIGRNKQEKEVIYAKSSGSHTDFPIIVLINEYSASASEILAGALRDNKRAMIMGKRSFGKGSVQSVVRLGDGSALKLTVARYYTPNGVSIQAEGISPDIAIEDVDPEALHSAIIQRQARREKDIEGHLPGDREKGAATPVTEKSPVAPLSLLWAKEMKKKSDLSPREELLVNDFQTLQAYNYLRALTVMDSFQAERAENRQPSAQKKSAASEAATQKE